MTTTEVFMPVRPGRYRLQAPDGRVRALKVIDMGGRLYAVHGLGLLGTPVELVEGEWVDRDEAAGT